MTHCRIERILLTNEMRKALSVTRDVHIGGAHQPPLQSQGREVPTGHSLNSETRPEGALASSGPDEPTPASLLLLQQAAEALEEAVRAANSYYRDMDADAAYFGRVAAALRERMGRE